MKHKIGEKTSHNYWSWTHGPRKTTHDTSGKRSWWWRSSRRSILPPAGCRERFVRLCRSWNRRGGGTKEDIAKRVPSRVFLEWGVNIGRRGPPGCGPTPRRPAGAARRGTAPASRLGGACLPSGPTLVISEVSVTLIFYMIFLEFLEHCNIVKTCNSQTSADRNWHWGALS